jgi:hypothetical protein
MEIRLACRKIEQALQDARIYCRALTWLLLCPMNEHLHQSLHRCLGDVRERPGLIVSFVMYISTFDTGYSIGDMRYSVNDMLFPCAY